MATLFALYLENAIRAKDVLKQLIKGEIRNVNTSIKLIDAN